MADPFLHFCSQHFKIEDNKCRTFCRLCLFFFFYCQSHTHTYTHLKPRLNPQTHTHTHTSLAGGDPGLPLLAPGSEYKLGNTSQGCLVLVVWNPGKTVAASLNLSKKSSGDKKKHFHCVHCVDLSLSLLKHFVPGCKARVQGWGRGGFFYLFFYFIAHPKLSWKMA